MINNAALQNTPTLLDDSFSLKANLDEISVKFIMAWLISSVPYVLIATYAGSISTLDNPKPAIITAISLTSIMWLAWYILKRHMSRQAAKNLSGKSTQ